MALAGMVELDDTDLSGGPADNEVSTEAEEPWAFQGVRVLAGDLADEEVWKERFQESRLREIQARRDSWNLMLRFLSQRDEAGDIFSESYKMAHPRTGLTRYPEASCGGCGFGRTVGRTPFTGEDPGCPGPVMGREILSETLRRILGGADLLVAHYPADQEAPMTEEVFARLVRALARHGLNSFVVDRSDRPLVEDALERHEQPYFISYVTEMGTEGGLLRPQTPEFVSVPTPQTGPIPPDMLRPWQQGRILFVSEAGRDPAKPNVAVADLRRPSIRAESLIAML
jgi:hypothetical protein